MKALSCVRGPPTLGKHFALFYCDNKLKMLVEKWGNAEEKGGNAEEKLPPENF